MVQLAEDLRVGPQQAVVDLAGLVGDLDRQVARQGRVHGAINGRLPARIELADDPVSADALGPRPGLGGFRDLDVIVGRFRVGRAARRLRDGRDGGHRLLPRGR